MKFKKLDINNKYECKFIEELYIEAFPPEERRPVELMYELHTNSSPFDINIIEENSIPLGFITLWDFDEFVFAEHFSIDKKQRNNGLGAKAMNILLQAINKPLVLEVEKPDDELAERRIKFYKGLGLILWYKLDYYQPPYSGYEESIPMYLMSIGNLDVQANFDSLKRNIYKTVYQSVI